MSAKRRSLTASKARERLNELEESTKARQHRIDQIEARLARSDEPDQKLTEFRQKLLKRQKAELSQLEKLQSLLKRNRRSESSEDGPPSGELEALHRSFEDLKAGLDEVRAQLDDRPREDVLGRLDQLEDRLGRAVERLDRHHREITELGRELEQEKQQQRRLSRGQNELEEGLENFRETLEETVVTNVDLTARAEDFDERIDSLSDFWEEQFQQLSGKIQDIGTALGGFREEVDERMASFEEELVPSSNGEPDPEVQNAVEQLDERLRKLASQIRQSSVAPSTGKAAPAATESAVATADEKDDIFDYTPVLRYGPEAVFEEV